MKHAKRFRLLFIGLLLLGYTSLLAAPTGYQLDWFSLDGGGGVAQGGTYALVGSIGQPDAGSLVGGSYQLRGGFWVGNQNDVYTSSVWLPLLLAEQAIIIPPTPTTQAPTVTVPPPTTSTAQPTATPIRTPTATPSPAEFEAQVLALVNQQRTQAGCAALTVDSRLRNAAYLHSQDMAVNNFFSHTGSNGSTFDQRVTAQGYTWSTVGENITVSRTTPQAAVDAWMNSSGHRTNILNCNYTQTGIGYYFQANDQGNVCNGTTCTNGPYFHYWTQVFARPQ